MKLNLNNKQKAFATFLVFGIIAFLFWFFSDNYASFVATTNPWLAMIVNIILNPAYIFLILWLWSEYGGRGIISGLMISLAIDIVSLTHAISKIGIIPTENFSYGFADTLFYKIINPFVSGIAGSIILYIILPLLLVYIALRVIRHTASFNRIFKEAI